MDIKNIIRNAAFLFVLSYFSGVMSGTLHFMSHSHLFLGANYLVVFVGFCFVAYWTRKDRFKNLMAVAALFWTFGLPERYAFGLYKEWLFSGLAIFLCAAGSWWLSRYFPKGDTEHQSALEKCQGENGEEENEEEE
ncbi:MAG: hypothetical protein CMH27_04550 [Micavibrio sp.]|nr:hypothetical protein [Micavibrio sp.]|tara:strand:- start:2611 stop:3018 length:408 start_codon:yes stop_codon:yes gene_type:complete